jgi:DNA-binding response OmpR family regulator
MSKTILVVDDEERLTSLVKAYLTQEGFRVVTARNGREALFIARQEKPDLIVLDLMMPEMDGYEFMRLHRKERETPILLLTARVEDSDKVLGLELGADDYMTKPFSPRELTARVRAVLRRGTIRGDAGRRVRVARNGLVIDAVKHDVRVDGERVGFTATEFRLLHFLASHSGRAFSRDELLSRVIGEHATVTDRNIDVHVRMIRRKLGRHRELIETVRGVGYRFRDEE